MSEPTPPDKTSEKSPDAATPTASAAPQADSAETAGPTSPRVRQDGPSLFLPILALMCVGVMLVSIYKLYAPAPPPPHRELVALEDYSDEGMVTTIKLRFTDLAAGEKLEVRRLEVATTSGSEPLKTTVLPDGALSALVPKNRTKTSFKLLVEVGFGGRTCFGEIVLDPAHKTISRVDLKE